MSCGSPAQYFDQYRTHRRGHKTGNLERKEGPMRWLTLLSTVTLGVLFVGSGPTAQCRTLAQDQTRVTPIDCDVLVVGGGPVRSVSCAISES